MRPVTKSFAFRCVQASVPQTQNDPVVRSLWRIGAYILTIHMGKRERGGGSGSSRRQRISDAGSVSRRAANERRHPRLTRVRVLILRVSAYTLTAVDTKRSQTLASTCSIRRTSSTLEHGAMTSPVQRHNRLANMPVQHKKHQSRDDDVYASADLSVSMPKFRMPDDEHDPRAVYSIVHDELMLDGNSRQILATFCQT